MSVLLNPYNVRWIVLHCSASSYGDVETFEAWHKARGFNGIGYHWTITNCYPKYENYKLKQPDTTYDGLVHAGRSEKFKGAHVKGHNWCTLGVVMTGAGGVFTSKQLISAVNIINIITARYPNIEGVKGHYEFTDRKTCPEIDMDYFRKYILGAYND